MAVHKSTIIIAPGHSSAYAPVLWSSFDSGANDLYFDVNGVDETKMLILHMGHSTLVCGVYIGTCASASSQTSKVYPYSAGKLGPMKINTTLVGDGHARSKFLSTVAADTEVFAIYCYGPFETARFADSRGYIKMSRAKIANVSTDEQHVAAILLP